MGGGFEEMEAIFGQVEVEGSKPFFFHVHCGSENDNSALAVCVTDFHSNTWQALKSTHQLEDMRDMIGIGGSWTEFVDYVIASLKSEDVKLVIEVQSKSGAATYAKLIAQKAKGMPRISISLTKLVDPAASGARANMVLELFNAFKRTRNSLINEQERCCQEKSVSLQRQLDSVMFSKRQKLQKTSDKSTSDVTQDASGLQATQTTASTKLSNRVVPAYRRAKVRGVLLQDTEDEQDN